MWVNRRRPNQTPMVQKIRCSVPMKVTDSVDCENTHATGAKPSSSRPVQRERGEEHAGESAQRHLRTREARENVEARQSR